MEDLKAIKAIDIQNRIFSVDIEKHKKFWFGYEMQQVGYKGVWRGVIQKSGLSHADSWKAMASLWPGSVPGLVKEMDEVGVELVFIDQFMTYSWHDKKRDVIVTLDEMDKIVKESNGRIIPGGGYDPTNIGPSLAELEEGVKHYGFKYMWYHPATYGIALDDKKSYPLYAKCQELGIPVTVQVGHAGEPVPCEGARPYYMDIVALDFPDLTLVLTHTGYPWIDEWMSLCWKHPNVYGCINAYYPKDLDPSIVKFMNGRGRDKIMWGTNSWGLTRFKKEFMELPMKDECRKMVLRDNALKVFKLDIKP
jgi:predicted TIM-barrel fold metal-dependent hydrolase